MDTKQKVKVNFKKRPSAPQNLSKFEEWRFKKETEFYNIHDIGHVSRVVVNQQVEEVLSASDVEVLAQSLSSEYHGKSQQEPFSKTHRSNLIKKGLSSISLGGKPCELKLVTLLTKDGKRVPLKHGVQCEYMVWTYEASFSKHAMEDPVGTMQSFAKNIAAGCNVPLHDLRVVAMMDGCIQFIIQGVQAIITALLPLIGHEAATLIVSSGVASMWGAAIGTGVFPGIGTAIGAGVGAVVGICIGVGGLLLQQRRLQTENQPQQEQQRPAPDGP